MPVIVQKGWFTKEQIQEDRNVLFLFGDNEVRKGTGGQAKVCRDEPNCVGIITKKKPDYEEGSYLNDYNLVYNMWQIVKDFLRVIKHIKKGGTVIFPADGIGTGIAELEKRAPQTYKFVQVMWDYCIWLGEDIETKRIQTAE